MNDPLHDHRVNQPIWDQVEVQQRLGDDGGQQLGVYPPQHVASEDEDSLNKM